MVRSIEILIFATILLVVKNSAEKNLSDSNTELRINQRTRFNLDILPEYKVEKHTSYSSNNGNSVMSETVLYRITEGPKSPLITLTEYQSTLIQHGIICNDEIGHCTVNQPLIAIAYLLVDQGYDVWLEQSDSYAAFNSSLCSEDEERARLLPAVEYILSKVRGSEITVIGNFNGSSKIFGMKLCNESSDDQSSISRFFHSIPGVKTLKKLWTATKNLFTSSYNTVVDTIGTQIDYVIDNLSVRELKEKVLTSFGSVSRMIGPTLTIDDFSQMIDHPDVHLTTPELVRKYGYEAETHRVKTEDGYILTVHRITGGNRHPPRAGKPVVILQHGILSSSADWVIMGPEKSLGYILSDEGYDVWMGNSRGNTYSMEHLNISNTDYNFWKFSWHEMGLYDTPALVDYVLNASEKETLSYIGHSQGVTQLLVTLSEKPEYNSKIYLAIGFAPMAYAGNMRSPLTTTFARFSTPLYNLFNLVGVNNFLPTNAFLTEIGRELCETKSVIQVICSNSLFLATGYDKTELNLTMVPIILGHTPAGASTMQFVHYAQLYNSKKFRRFDFLSSFANRQIYNQDEPPEYNLQNVRIPMNIFYAANDLLADYRDVEKLARELPNTEYMQKISFENFNHIDFMYGIDAPRIVYQSVIQRLRPRLQFAVQDYNIDVRMGVSD